MEGPTSAALLLKAEQKAEQEQCRTCPIADELIFKCAGENTARRLMTILKGQAQFR
jgi:hypothetical protein